VVYLGRDERYGMTAIGIFGSYARNEQRLDGDLDVLDVLNEAPS
jgi:predicted nucleotidyltransferase